MVKIYVFWLSFAGTILLAGLFATKPAGTFLRATSSSFASTIKSLIIPTLSLSTTLPFHASSPDTTAMILNWSRLSNVIRIVSLLCSAQVDDMIAKIVVWNNSPRKLEHGDFSSARCPSTKLRIHNSPENLYFQARFIACAEASTTYCFIQDDDYLIYPEIIHTLHARITDPKRDSRIGIHLLPPHEHLSSALRTIFTSSHIHTSFAWLGYGTLIPRSQVLAFLNVMGPSYLNVSDDEMKMADNFYTVLSNNMQEVWFDQGIELGGGEAFTVGQQGVEHNRRYIMRAGEYLDFLLSNHNAHADTFPFVNFEPIVPGQDPVTRAPCLKFKCLLETTIELLPPNMVHQGESAVDMLALEENNSKLLGAGQQSHYLDHPPSNAVDGLLDTAFCSPDSARSGDSISLDMLSNISGYPYIQFVWLVDFGTENILRSAMFEVSQNGVHWIPSESVLACSDKNTSAAVSTGSPTFLRECNITLSSTASRSNSGPRLYRARLVEAREEKWCVYEVWVRGIE